MNIPALISRNTLSQLNCPDTVAVRVLLHSVSNEGPARLHCRNRQYVFERNYETGCHVLDIPMSVWMHGVNPGRYRDQRSVCDDFRELPGASFTVHLIGEVPATIAIVEPVTVDSQESGALAQIRRLLSALGAPEQVEYAFNLAASENAEKLEQYVTDTIALIEQATEETVETVTPPVPAVKPKIVTDLLHLVYTSEEKADLDKMHWKTFEKKYGMVKADFITSKESKIV